MKRIRRQNNKIDHTHFDAKPPPPGGKPPIFSSINFSWTLMKSTNSVCLHSATMSGKENKSKIKKTGNKTHLDFDFSVFETIVYLNKPSRIIHFHLNYFFALRVNQKKLKNINNNKNNNRGTVQ